MFRKNVEEYFGKCGEAVSSLFLWDPLHLSVVTNTPATSMSAILLEKNAMGRSGGKKLHNFFYGGEDASVLDSTGTLRTFGFSVRCLVGSW